MVRFRSPAHVTLLGRNATGGLVQFVTARPSHDWEGYLTLGALER